MKEKIVNTEVKIGDLFSYPADAYVVPQSNSGAYSDALWNVLNGKYTSALERYNTIVSERTNGLVMYGEAVASPPENKNTPYIIHAAVVQCLEHIQFEIIQKAVYTALAISNKENFERIAVPLIGTKNFHGVLSTEEAAEAIISATYFFCQNRNIDQNLIIMTKDGEEKERVEDVIKHKDYMSVEQRFFDNKPMLERWADMFV